LVAAHAQSAIRMRFSTDQALTPAILGPILSDPIQTDSIGGCVRIFHALSIFGIELLGGGGATIVMPQISVKICIRNRISARCVCRQFGKSVAKFG